MAFNLRNNNRRGIGNIVIAIIAGAMFSIGPFIAKKGLPGAFSFGSVIAMMTSPYVWAGVAIGIAAFVLMQKSMFGEHVSLIVSITTGISIIIAVLLGWLSGEKISALRMIGLIVIIIGLAFLVNNKGLLMKKQI